jgi:NADH-ubiquinone oxidoreductase chain 1
MTFSIYLHTTEVHPYPYLYICKGPNKVGFVGLFQPFSDAIKLFAREQYFLLVSNYLSYYYSPVLVYFFLCWFGFGSLILEVLYLLNRAYFIVLYKFRCLYSYNCW